MAEYTREELEQLRDHVRSLSPDEREKLAQEYREAAAPGIVFEWMHRGGWRPASQLAGDGIEGGALADIDPNTVRRRRKK